MLKCSPLRDMGFLNISCLSCSVSREIVATRTCAGSCDYLGYATVAGTGRDSVFQVCILLSWVLKLDDQTLVHFIPQPTWTLPCAHRPKRLSVRRRRSRTVAESVCGLDVNQSLSQPTKFIPLTPHKVPELTKLQEASYAGIR